MSRCGRSMPTARLGARLTFERELATAAGRRRRARAHGPDVSCASPRRLRAATVPLLLWYTHWHASRSLRRAAACGRARGRPRRCWRRPVSGSRRLSRVLIQHTGRHQGDHCGQLVPPGELVDVRRQQDGRGGRGEQQAGQGELLATGADGAADQGEHRARHGGKGQQGQQRAGGVAAVELVGMQENGQRPGHLRVRHRTAGARCRGRRRTPGSARRRRWCRRAGPAGR